MYATGYTHSFPQDQTLIAMMALIAVMALITMIIFIRVRHFGFFLYEIETPGRGGIHCQPARPQPPQIFSLLTATKKIYFFV